MRKSKKNPTFHSLEVLLRGNGYHSANLEAILPWSRPTCLKKIKEPGRLELNDLVYIVRDGKVSLTQIIDAIKGDIT